MDQKAQTESPFLALYDESADALFRHCFYRVSNRELAEDLVQESFMRTWNYLAEGNTIANPRAFLYRTAGNLIIDYYRRKKETSLEMLQEVGFDPVGEDEHSVMRYAIGEETLALLARLPDPHREILTLRYIQGRSIGEIAAQMKLTENAVSVRINRALKKFKHLFDNEI